MSSIDSTVNRLATPEGHFFEDFIIGQTFEHGVPRTITEGDVALYTGLTGNRFALYCAEPLARKCGFEKTPVDNFLVFHIAFGKTVNDVSLNAVANLGYAEVQFQQVCYPGDTLFVESEVIGLKENSSGKNGVVYVRSKAVNQKNQLVVSWIRWVMVEKRQPSPPTFDPVIPEYENQINLPETLIPSGADFRQWKASYSDSQYRFDDIQVDDEIFHRDGITINDSDHSLATRLYQNNARVHFDQHLMVTQRQSQRLVYGGHIISLCRSLSYNGLANATWLCGINAGTHANPSYAGDTIYSLSRVIEKRAVTGRNDLGLVRLRTLGIKNDSPEAMNFLFKQEGSRVSYHKNLVLDLDYWVIMLNQG